MNKKMKKIVVALLITSIFCMSIISASVISDWVKFEKGYTANMRQVWDLGDLYRNEYNKQDPNKYLDYYQDTLTKAINYLGMYKNESVQGEPSAPSSVLITSLCRSLGEIQDIITENNMVEKDFGKEALRYQTITSKMLTVQNLTGYLTWDRTITVYSPWWITIENPVLSIFLFMIFFGCTTASATYLFINWGKKE